MEATIHQVEGEIQKTTPGEGEVRSLGLSLTYHVWGPSDGPTVVLLHGFLDQGRSFARVAEALADRWRVVALDQRGHGRSEHVGAGGYYHFTDYVLDLDALLTHLGVDQAVLVGHSMGASVGLYFAGAFPERVAGLALLDGIGPGPGKAEDAPRLMRRWIQSVRAVESQPPPSGRSLDALAERVGVMSSRADDATLRQLAEAASQPHPDGGRRWRYDPLHRTPGPHYVDDARIRAFLAAVTCPTLLLWGEHTPLKVRQADDRVASLRDATVVTLPGAGHNLHHEAPAETAAALRAWLEVHGL